MGSRKKLMVYYYWCWFFFASKQPKTCRKYPEVGFVTAIVCVFLWCRCVLFLTKSTKGDRFCGSMAVVASPLKLCTKGAEDDPDTGGKRRTEQEEGPTRRKASDVITFLFDCFVYLNYLVNLWKVLCALSPFYRNYRQDITFNHKSKRTTLAVAKLHSIGASVQDHGWLGFLLEVGTIALRCKIATLKDFLKILVESCNTRMCEVAKCNLCLEVIWFDPIDPISRSIPAPGIYKTL